MGPIWFWVIIGLLELAAFAVKLALWTVVELALSLVLVCVSVWGTAEELTESRDARRRITAAQLHS